MLSECAERQHLPLSVLDVREVQLYFEFAADHGRNSKPLTFDVCYPDLCTLRSQRSDGAAVVRKYLRKWRIAVA